MSIHAGTEADRPVTTGPGVHPTVTLAPVPLGPPRAPQTRTATGTISPSRRADAMDPASTAGYRLPVDHGPAAPQEPDPVDEATRLMLRLIAAGQERERQHLCDAFHDGPIQDLTAVLLTCAAVRRTLTGPAAEKLAAVETQLRDAITTLQLPTPAFRAGSDARRVLTSALASRVRGPLARELDAVIEVDDAPPNRAELAEVLSAVQVLLLESDPWRPARHASVTIRSSQDAVTLTLRALPDPCSATGLDAAHDAAARTGRLRRVGSLVGAHITEDQAGGGWGAALTWPRQRPDGRLAAACPNPPCPTS